MKHLSSGQDCNVKGFGDEADTAGCDESMIQAKHRKSAVPP